ncbi:MAG: sulfurtransferase [Phaeodactylibacter sp.]|nr:sulfurtransferase [Phaeodactylibacter sp.]MCB0615656.1 sulfurtransferase [Phaeodactylibacter sp.]
MYTTLISTKDLAQNLDNEDWAVIDCRFNLSDTEAGRRAYRNGHIPGARYVHLDEGLSGPIVPGKTGRHPLPNPDVAAMRFERLGIGNDVQVVAYDDAGGMVASRLWWMLRWLGHDAVAVLDGGWPRWVGEGRPVETAIPEPYPRAFIPHPRPDLLVDVNTVEAIRKQPEFKLVDSRAAERYRGEVEPIDPVAGHIPGALNLSNAETVNAEGLFLNEGEQQQRFQQALGEADAAHTVFYCGSGVSACRNILAYKHAGLGDAKLYPGSWSEWITGPEREVGRG